MVEVVKGKAKKSINKKRERVVLQIQRRKSQGQKTQTGGQVLQVQQNGTYFNKVYERAARSKERRGKWKVNEGK